MVIPNWFTTYPVHFGTTSGGSIKADQWRAIATLYLPLVLIQVWPIAGESISAIWLKMTTDLMTGIYACSSHTVTLRSIDIYRRSMISYFAYMKEYFPKVDWVPNYHAALHVPEFLLLYGPAYGWWTFPFERLIRELQNVPTNAKMGRLLFCSKMTFRHEE